MFICVTEAGPTLYRVEVLDTCWNVYESVLTNDVKTTENKFKEMYQID